RSRRRSYVGDDRGGRLAQRALEGAGQGGVVLVAGGEDAALGHLARQIFQDLGERLLRDLLAGGVVDVDLAIAHLERVERPRVLQRHVDFERKALERRRQ